MDVPYARRPYLEFYNGNLIIHLPDYYNGLMIIIPLVAGVCFSLTALMWAFYVFYTFHKHGGKISAFIILLIINDLAELLLSAVIASYIIDRHVKSSATKSLKKIIEEEDIRSEWFWFLRDRIIILIHLLITFRIVGLYFHQLVALKSILSLKNQLFSANVFSPLCSIISYIILWLLAFGCQFLSIWLNLLFNFLPCCILAITCILTCKASSGPDHIKPGSAVLIVSTLTLITFCATAGLVIAFETPRYGQYFDRTYSHFSPFLISLRVVSDPLLCVLVYKEQLRLYKKQRHTEVSTDQRSV